MTRTVGTLPCIICKKKLESAVGNTVENQPAQGVEFSSFGHYGSTVFDPINSDRMLVANICDECLSSAAKENLVALSSAPKVTHADLVIWKP